MRLIKFNLAIIITILLCTVVIAQESIVFDKRYILDYGSVQTDGKQTIDGGYISAGYSSLSMVDDAYLLFKTDSLGNLSWYNYFGMQHSQLWGVDITIDGDYIGAGLNMDNPEWQERAVLIKYNQYGDTIWKKEYLSPNTPGDTVFSQTFFYDLVCTQDTAVVAVGACHYNDGLYLGSGADPFIVKTDYNGDTIWTWRAYIFNQLHPEYGNVVFFSAVTETNEGDYIAVGRSKYPIGMKTFHGPNGGILAKFTKNGELIYFKEFHDVAGTIFSDVEVDSQGNIIVFGDKINYEHEDSIGIESGLVVKFDSGGNKLFYRAISSIKSVVGKAGCVTENDEILFIGWLIPPDELDWWVDTWLIKYNSDGEKLWEKIIGGKSSVNYLHKIVTTSDDGLALFGSYGELNQNFKAWIVKTDSLGNGIYDPGWINSINKEQFSLDVSFYPNPANNYFTIELPEESNMFTIEIINLSGQVVYSEQSNSNKLNIQTSDLSQGIYLLNIQSDTKVYTGKLSVKH